MSILAIAAMTAGIIMALLGGLWFLQGAAIIHLQPIACVAECEAITGGSTLWAVIGAVTFLIGLAIVGTSARRIRR